MENSERLIGVVKNALVGNNEKYPTMQYDLYLTDRRLVAFCSLFPKHHYGYWGSFIGSLFGFNALRESFSIYGFIGFFILALIGGLIGEGIDRMLKSRDKKKI